MKTKQLIFISILLIAIRSYALPLQLSDEPLFLNQSVPPALAITFDDSGSMSWGYMPDTRSFDDGDAPSLSSYNWINYTNISNTNF